MHRFSRWLLFLLCITPAFAQQPIDLLRTRLGDMISPDEQAYFGLFFTLGDRFQYATYTEAAGDLRFHLVLSDGHRGDKDSTLMLDASNAALLARYLGEYETLFDGDGLVPRLRQYALLRRDRIARPPKIYRKGTRVRIAQRNGEEVEGTLLWADVQSVGVLSEGRHFDPQHPNRVTVLAPPDIEHIEAPGISDNLAHRTGDVLVGLTQAAIPLYDDGDAQARDALLIGGMAAGLAVLKLFPRNQLDVRGQRGRYSAVLPRLMRMSRYRTLRAPELAARSTPQPMNAHAPDDPVRKPSRRISLALSHANEATPTRSFTVYASREPFEQEQTRRSATTTVRPQVRAAGLQGEVTVQLRQGLHLRIAAARHRSVALPGNTHEVFSRLTLVGGSVQLHRPFPQSRRIDGWFSAGMGVRYVTTRLKGRYLVTAADDVQTAAESAVYTAYELPGRRWQPTLHAGYEVFVRPELAVYAALDAAPPLVLHVGEQRATYRGRKGDYTAVLPDHDAPVALLRYGFGLRFYL